VQLYTFEYRSSFILPQSKTAGILTLLQDLITDTMLANRQAEQTSFTLEHVDSPSSLFGNRVYLKTARTIAVIGNGV
jgi:hypothetical protein